MPRAWSSHSVPGVTRFAVGERVTSHFYSRWIDGEPGADEPDYSLGRTAERRLKALTDGRGVDQLLDVVGGDRINQSVAATKPAGTSTSSDSCQVRRRSWISCRFCSARARSTASPSGTAVRSRT